MLLQMQWGSKSLEQHSESYLKSSTVGRFLNQAAVGGASLFEKGTSGLAHATDIAMRKMGLKEVGSKKSDTEKSQRRWGAERTLSHKKQIEDEESSDSESEDSYDYRD